MLKLATFHTTTGAMRFERQLKALGEAYTLKPVPRMLKAGCGIAVEFTWSPEDYASITDLEYLYRVENGSYHAIDYTDQ